MDGAFLILSTAAGVAVILTAWRYLQLRMDMRSAEMQHKMLQETLAQQRELTDRVLKAAFATEPTPVPPVPPEEPKEEEEQAVAAVLESIGADGVSITGV